MEKLKLHSPDFTQANIAKLAELFPNCVTEIKDGQKDELGRMKDEMGGENSSLSLHPSSFRKEPSSLRYAIDFDLLKQELSTSIVDGPQERYQLNWPGKREALLTANAPIAKTLRPCREESVDFDTTQNLYIEGDNLDALKLLQETYLGKVKMIYIDPPYNTGKDFIYKDDFAEETASYFFRSNQKDALGNRLVSNDDTNGRYHSDWLSFMYSRLRLSRTLLTDDGAIFISINHKEISNLKKLCDEIFGESNMLCQFAWRTDGNFDNQAKFKYCHEYLLAYAKNESLFLHPLVIDPNTPSDSKLFRPEIRNTIVKNGPKNPASIINIPVGFPCSFNDGIISIRNNLWPHYYSDAIVEDGKLKAGVTVYSGWSSKELLEDFINNGCKEIIDSKGQVTSFEISNSGAIEAVKKRGEPSHVISFLSNLGGPQKAAAEILKTGVFFDDYPKPVELIKYIVKMIRGDDFLVLDFFSGSATTAHAVMALNAEEGAKRRFLMVQLPEICGQETGAYKAGFKTIAEIGKERIRCAGQKIKTDNMPDLDIGFRVLKVDNSNMKDVYYTPDKLMQGDLDQFTDNIRDDSTPEDLLFQVLLDWGVDLTLPITQETIAGFTVLFVDDNALAACFDADITEAFVKELAARHPMRVVFRDAGFASDSVKINIEQIFKLISPATEIKTL